MSLPFDTSPRSLRQFALAWLVFFLIIATWTTLKHGHWQSGIALAAIGLVIGIYGLIRPASIRWLYIGSMLLTFPIGWVVSRVALALLFYGLVTPLALWFRLRGRDVLRRKPELQTESMWQPKETPDDLRRYLRQY